MPKVVSIGVADAPYSYSQSEVKDFVAGLFSDSGEFIQKMIRVFDNSGIEFRHFINEKDWYSKPRTFVERNSVYLNNARAMAARALSACIEEAGLGAREVEHIIFVSSTGISTPTIDAVLYNEFDFDSHIKRTPIWGSGCLGGAVGLSRAMEFTRAYADSCVLVVAVELCSLAFQLGDCTKSNVVASALFSDGAACALVVGAEHRLHHLPGVSLIDSMSTTYPDTLDVMGWDVSDSGLRVIFSKDIPTIVRGLVKDSIVELLYGRGLELEQVVRYLAHPGGMKILQAYRDALGLGEKSLEISKEVLRTHGNMSSPTVLYVLKDYLRSGAGKEGELGIITALGPGFGSELILFEFG
ncbi:MAG: type III polyketide synthase [Candidatus Dadabacteria bacterium]|nr:type III polyketide synthase [Candidatus Dadabacteria bacterium]